MPGRLRLRLLFGPVSTTFSLPFFLIREWSCYATCTHLCVSDHPLQHRLPIVHSLESCRDCIYDKSTMDVTHSDTHALLRELQPDDGSEYYREHAPQASLPYTQPRILPTDVRHTYERFPRKDSVRDRIQHQAPLYESQSTQGSGCTLFNQSDAHLDAYGTWSFFGQGILANGSDRALLARTTFPRDNQQIKDGRVMLKQPPGPTRDRNRSNGSSSSILTT